MGVTAEKNQPRQTQRCSCFWETSPFSIMKSTSYNCCRWGERARLVQKKSAQSWHVLAMRGRAEAVRCGQLAHFLCVWKTRELRHFQMWWPRSKHAAFLASFWSTWRCVFPREVSRLKFLSCELCTCCVPATYSCQHMYTFELSAIKNKALCFAFVFIAKRDRKFKLFSTFPALSTPSTGYYRSLHPVITRNNQFVSQSHWEKKNPNIYSIIYITIFDIFN